MSSNIYSSGGYLNTPASSSAGGYMNPSPSNYPLSLGPSSMGAPPGMHHRSSDGPASYFDYPSSGYEGSYYGQPSHSGGAYEQPKYYESKPQYQGEGSAPPSASVGLVQRLSGLIKAQLPYLQSLSVGMESRRREEESFYKKPHRSRSRSRSKRDRKKRNSRSRSPVSMDWLCPRCSFSNYEWRERCKRCNESKATKSFMPGPQDWRCPKCNNINYARRLECNRCKAPRDEK